MHASPKMQENLQKVLVDLIDLHLQGKEAHWNILGHNFRDLHLQLDELVDAAREFSDDIAERMRALFLVPDGRASTIAASSHLDQFPEGEISTHDAIDAVTLRIYQATGTMREVHDGVDSEDPSTADLLHAIIDRLEQIAWMMGAENRLPRESIAEALGDEAATASTIS
ncbi:Dps family protein [Frondihabitans australicus]|uniref:Starvation-inducible DNA-binding protein n=1 Tax=Frondihabitans australicus TaxID=386892 RepID=A0A495IBM5_9MICO|nr:DNA starvation/stationary phase protection protein [Frondihabitans australicus]RKR73397.1 starvation-inducible DNA-binding protein [Frondihabitans australicus]